MANEAFKGIFPALLTPMLDDDSIDFESLDRFVQNFIDVGVQGFYVGGSTGEGFILNGDERKRVLETVLDATCKRGTVIAHVGAISTRESVLLAQHAEQAGADAVSAVVPFYYKTTLTEIKDHYLTIMKATSLPLIIYHFPGATGVNLSLDFYEEMASHPQCLGVKFTSMNLFEMQQIRARCGENFLIYNGHDEVFTGGVVMGADGAIGSTFNMMAHLFKDMLAKAERGELNELRPLQVQANEVIAHLLKYDVIPYEKYICYLQGWFKTPKARQPLKQLTQAEQEAITEFYRKSSLLQDLQRTAERCQDPK